MNITINVHSHMGRSTWHMVLIHASQLEEWEAVMSSGDFARRKGVALDEKRVEDFLLVLGKIDMMSKGESGCELMELEATEVETSREERLKVALGSWGCYWWGYKSDDG